MPYVPYNHTTDPTAFLVLDDRSTFTVSGSQLVEWANVSASGLAYNAVASFGTGVTLGTDTNGYKYLEFNGASGLKIPSSSGFDAEFANTGNAGGKTILVVFDLPSNVGGSGDCFLCNKGSSAGVVTTHSGTDNLAWFTYGPLPQLQRNGAAQSWRPCPGGVGSFAITTVTGSTGAGQLDGYRDGQRLYRDGAPSNAQYGTMNPADGAGYDLSIGSRGDAVYALTGKIRAVVVWNREPLHHEILATHRYYANRYGFPETLTNQPYSLICDSNSESTVMQGFGGAGSGFNGEIGIFDRVANSLGVGLDANFMLGLASRTTSNMIFDFSTYVAPLIAYLQYLGVPPIVIQWEGINDGFVAAHVTTYAELVIATGAKFITGTSMAKDGIGHSGPTDGTVISTYNVAVLEVASGQYPVAGLGYDATLSTMATVSTFDAAYLSDGVHLLTTAIVLAVPYFVTAVTASLSLTAPTFKVFFMSGGLCGGMV